MTPLTSRDIVRVLGPVDDHLVAEILATGASLEEFGQARTWMIDDEAVAGTSAASGAVGRLVEILEALEQSLQAEE